jgi:hypothetical protein
MTSYTVKATFDSCELRFKLTNQDGIAPPLEKKLKTMGFPNMWVTPSPKKANSSANGVVAVDASKLDLSERVPVSRPGDGASFEVAYSPDDKSVTVRFNGTFECWTTDDVKCLENVECVFIEGITLQDAKGKDIKGPKDEYGMACRLEANVTGSYSGPSEAYQVPVNITLEKAQP